MRRLLIYQSILLGLATLALGFVQDVASAKACLYGGLMALANSALLILHAGRAERLAGMNARSSLKHVYLCAAERVVLTVALFAIGFAVLRLPPLPLLIGFVVAQVGAFLNGLERVK